MRQYKRAAASPLRLGDNAGVGNQGVTPARGRDEAPNERKIERERDLHANLGYMWSEERVSWSSSSERLKSFFVRYLSDPAS